jgi:toxin ParE1/3/4
MARYFLTSRARSDIRDIARFTRLQWGIAQRDRYMAALEKKLVLLAGHPASGRPRDDIGKGLRSALCGSHIYRPVEGGVRVFHVVHTSRDIAGLMESDE